MSFPEFSVGCLEGAKSELIGLGVLSWVLRKLVAGVQEELITSGLSSIGREMFGKELAQVSLQDMMFSKQS